MASVPPLQTGQMQLGHRGFALIKAFEGCAKLLADGRVAAYPDPASPLAQSGVGSGDPWTIGWGATGHDIKRGTVWSQAQCDARFAVHLTQFVAEVNDALLVPGGGYARTTQSQFDALVSFHFNTGAIRKASLTRLHRAGSFELAAAEFGKWVNARGKSMTGLIRRRKAEAALYRSET